MRENPVVSFTYHTVHEFVAFGGNLGDSYEVGSFHVKPTLGSNGSLTNGSICFSAEHYMVP